MKKLIKKIKKSKWFKIGTNKFMLATLGFIFWMLFLDVNSFLMHLELNAEKKDLQQSIEYYEAEITTDKKQLDELTSNPEMLEKFAREQYWMKRPGEEIYLIDEK